MAADDSKTVGPVQKQREPPLPAGERNPETNPPSDPARATTAELAAGRAPASAGGELPASFPRYRVLKKLGSGGMGNVYLAEDSQLQRQVALKVPRFGLDDDPEILERFYREARAAATIEHPNICPIYDVGEAQGVHFVSMAYIEGRSLAEMIRGGQPLPQRPVAAVIRKLALALQEAHARGVIHRDLKPANIMINRRKEPVVMDFGLARRSGKDERMTQDGALLGTPAYMPPEQVHGDVDAMGPGCDIYSLGVILYEMLTGQLPFQGSLTSILAQIVSRDPKPPSQLRPDVDPALEAICLKAMSKRIEARYPSMQAFAAALSEYLKVGSKSDKQSPAAHLAQPRPTQPPAGESSAAASTSQTGGDGIATQLLARLADRLDADAQSRSSEPPRPPQRSGFGLLLGGGILLLLLIGAGVVYLVTHMGNTAVHVDTTVVVQLQGLSDKLTSPRVTLILLDGRPVTKEELAKPLSLATGEHELVMKSAAGAVLDVFKFPVGYNDDQGSIQIAAATAVGASTANPGPAPQPGPSAKRPGAAPQSRVSAASTPLLDPANLLAKEASVDLKALEKYFIIQKNDYDPESRRVSFLVEARRNFSYVAKDVGFSVRLYDADDARVGMTTLAYEGGENVKQGGRLRAYFYWPKGFGSSSTDRITRLLLLEQNETKFTAGPRPELPKLDLAQLPVQEWDLRPLEEMFAILKAEYDSNARSVRFLVEARRPIGYLGKDRNLQARFYDSDEVSVRTDSVTFLQSEHVLEGERLWASIAWSGGGFGKTDHVKKVVLEPR